MTYMEMLAGTSRTNTPAILRGTVQDSRSASRLAENQRREEPVSREIRECFRQDRYGKTC